jgi:short-subunit dehydrogenase
MRRTLNGQIAIVTGASAGIGRAIALGLAGEGVRVGLVSRAPSRLEALMREWPGAAPPPIPLVADLADGDSLERLAADVIARLQAVDIVVHCAGTIAIGRFSDLPVQRLDEQYELNVRAPFLLTQRLLPSIVASRGQIVFVNSSAGLVSRAGVSQYGASKHALKALADSLREEVHADGVRVISVYPGRTATALQQTVRAMEGRPFEPERYLQPGDVAAAVIGALTMPETAEVKDISIRPMNEESAPTRRPSQADSPT